MSQPEQHPSSGKSSAADPATEDPASAEAPAHPEAQERREWQGGLRRHADERSSGSDESPANSAEPAPGANTGLHGGLVR
ncbi:hypothetical protein [Azohydromonas caseinilytica]|jgi:hypothetical protein|uniref:Uncharacterized protein n=1 Tax=Azohydromonas caseinilytica TaxID=2728836 RepID=A0A848FJS4_9BURK|nr:hypothetical protein [Azohydromonas caseinilytica]NML18589.1 hypothetical protein [Azohydromonas caseinilytica]